MRDELAKKASNRVCEDQEEKVPIAFKFSDGSKIEHDFLPTSTVKVGLSGGNRYVWVIVIFKFILQDMYQFVFTIEGINLPFTLRAILTRLEIPVSDCNDLLSDRSLKESIIVIEDAKDMDIDSFLDKIQEVYQCGGYFI